MILQDMQQFEIFKKPIRKDNKYKITNASYINKIVIVREDTQITLLHEGDGDVVTEKRENEITGLVAQDSGAPKFVEL